MFIVIIIIYHWRDKPTYTLLIITYADKIVPILTDLMGDDAHDAFKI